MSEPRLSRPVSQPDNGVTAGEYADKIAVLALATFGVLRNVVTDEDQRELSDAIVAFTVRWANDRYDLGIPEHAPTSDEEQV